ncbi:hypothetical protein T440DRAFT_204238 [Plenodomus tracheiphilus IPT5]|uniref:Carbohydrate-binding module family 13 protein n=1 Tax=Plenodomus tracheiphilus IPT5 TaxID=1408161 RepID=A0A6A7BIP1_9PLEO|nr:hypothetical protein T440DRAFT_204238 [Plenodomus tracheiphilus IPT5]
MPSESSDSNPPPPVPFNPTTWYQLKNSHLPSTHSLDVVNDNGHDSLGLLKIARDGYYAGQYWQFNLKSDGTTHALRTWWLGPNRLLDVYARDMSSTQILLPARETPGQCWKVEGWGDGTWQISNGLSSDEGLCCLDTVEEEGGVTVKMNAVDAERLLQR